MLDSELHALLRRSRRQRVLLTWLVAVLFVLVTIVAVGGAMINRANTVSACERGTQAAFERAELANHVGAYELARQAQARTRLDCGDAASLWPL